jgi:hypothetical protein
MKNVVFWDIKTKNLKSYTKTKFIPLRKHITSPLQSPVGQYYVRFEVFTAVTMRNVFWDIKPQFLLHRRHITSPLHGPAS